MKIRRSNSFTKLLKKNHSGLLGLASGPADATDAALNARALLMLSEGMPPERIAQELGITKYRVSAVRQRFIILGLPGVHDPEPLSGAA